jgi:hypothetical protein
MWSLKVGKWRGFVQKCGATALVRKNKPPASRRAAESEHHANRVDFPCAPGCAAAVRAITLCSRPVRGMRGRRKVQKT